MIYNCVFCQHRNNYSGCPEEEIIMIQHSYIIIISYFFHQFCSRQENIWNLSKNNVCFINPCHGCYRSCPARIMHRLFRICIVSFLQRIPSQTISYTKADKSDILMVFKKMQLLDQFRPACKKLVIIHSHYIRC